MNNDQATPPAAQAESSDHDKELVDAALHQAGVTSSAPSVQPSTTTVPPVGESVSAPVVGVESSYNPTDVASVAQEESTTSSSTPVEAPATTSTPVAEIPVNDNTAVTPDTTADPVVSEPVQEAQANDPIAQAQTLGATSLEEKPFTADTSATPVMQVPAAQPEGLVAKFLHIFKK